MRMYSNMGMVVAAAAAMIAAPAAPEAQTPKVRKGRLGGFDANINPKTGKPHKHSREIARRLRQQARTGATQ